MTYYWNGPLADVFLFIALLSNVVAVVEAVADFVVVVVVV